MTGGPDFRLLRDKQLKAHATPPGRLSQEGENPLAPITQLPPKNAFLSLNETQWLQTYKQLNAQQRQLMTQIMAQSNTTPVSRVVRIVAQIAGPEVAKNFLNLLNRLPYLNMARPVKQPENVSEPFMMLKPLSAEVVEGVAPELESRSLLNRLLEPAIERIAREIEKILGSLEAETQGVLFQQSKLLDQNFNMQTRAAKALEELLAYGVRSQHPDPLVLYYALLLQSLTALPLHPPQQVRYSFQPPQEDEEKDSGASDPYKVIVFVNTTTMGRLKISVGQVRQTRLLVEVEHEEPARNDLMAVEGIFRHKISETGFPTVLFNYLERPEPVSGTPRAVAPASEPGPVQEAAEDPKPAIHLLNGSSVVLVTVANLLARLILEADTRKVTRRVTSAMAGILC